MELINRLVARFNAQPNKIAISDSNISLTYRELDCVTNEMAAKIRHACHGGPCIIICDDKLASVITIISSIKAGSAYIPISGSDSSFRMNEIIRQTGSRCVVGADSTCNPTLNDQISYFDHLKTISNHTSTTPPAIAYPLQNNSAYILYTSGSTGRPKGVIQSQHYILHIADSLSKVMGLTNDDKISLIPELTFSASMMDIFSAFLSGAELCVIDTKNAGFRGIEREIDKKGITVYHSIPSLFRGVVTASDNSKFSTIRYIYLAGETLLKTDIALFKSKFRNDTILINGLGCTEFNILTQNIISKEREFTDDIIPVGFAPAAVKIMLEKCDRYQEDGVGEIVIESNELGCSYISEDGNINSPITISESGIKRFKTGDIGKFDSSGQLVHLGRSDYHCKISGKLVNLIEIENVVRQHCKVLEVAVVPIEIGGSLSAVLFFVAETDCEHEIKSELKRILPRYMLPQKISRLNDIPRTHSGKIDRKTLIEGFKTNKVTSALNQKIGLENYLMNLWSELLEIEEISIDDSFFDIGGSSMLAFTAQSKIEKEYAVELTIVDLFKNPTLRELTSFLDEQLLKGYSA